MNNKVPRWIFETFFWYLVLVALLIYDGLHYLDAIIFTTLLCCFGWGMMIIYPFFDSVVYLLWKKESSDYLTKKYFFITIIGLIMFFGSAFLFKALYING